MDNMERIKKLRDGYKVRIERSMYSCTELVASLIWKYSGIYEGEQ